MPRTRGDGVAPVTLAIAIGLFAPAAGVAQQTDIGFTLSFYNPFGALVESGSKGDSNYFQQRLQGTPALGVHVIVWTSSKLGFAASVNISPSDVAQSDSTGVHDHSSAVVLGGARVIYAFTPLYFKPPPGHRETPWSFYVGAGLGFASRSGAVWAYSSGLTSPAVLLNVGVRTAVGGRSVLRFDIEDYISQAQFDKGLPTETAARLHNDVLISLSVSYRAVK